MPIASAPRMVASASAVVGGERRTGRTRGPGPARRTARRRAGCRPRRRRSRSRSPSAIRPPRRSSSPWRPAPVKPWPAAGRPTGRRDRGVGAQHDVQLLVVEMDGVGDQHVRPEHAELGRGARAAGGRCGPGSWSASPPCGERWKVRPTSAGAGQLAGAGHQLVAHQVVADERHPCRRPGRRRAARRAAPPGGRAPRRPVRRTARPSTSQPHGRWCRACRPRRMPAGDPLRVRHRARFDGAGDAVGDGLDAGQRGRQLVVVAGVRARARARPSRRSPPASRSRRGCTSAPAGRR